MIIVNNSSKSSIGGIHGTTYVNGKKIDRAQSISITDDGVYVNGVLLNDLDKKSIEIKVEGSVDSINSTSGDVSVNGYVNSVSTASGDVHCKDVKGNVHTMSGNVTCGDITGSVSTMSGNVYRK